MPGITNIKEFIKRKLRDEGEVSLQSQRMIDRLAAADFENRSPKLKMKNWKGRETEK